MKKVCILLGGITFFLVLCTSGCTSKKKMAERYFDGEITEEEKMVFNRKEPDTVEIASDSTEYEVIIIDPGFNFWLQSIARPKGYYSQPFLENRNQLFVMNYNQRVLQPQRYGADLYQLQIDYDANIDYGYELNYKLYNYFIYFQRKYNQRLGPFVPRI